MSDVEDAGGSTGQPTPVRVKEVGTTTVACMHETETIDVFAEKLAGIALKSASLGEMINEAKLVKKLLKVVPRKFIHLVASLEQVLDLKTVGFEDVVGRLKAYEERVCCDDDEQKMVMFTRGGGRSTGGGRNTGGGAGGDDYGGSWFLSRERWKGKMGRNNCGDVINNRDGSSGSSGSGSKPKNNYKPNKLKQSNNQPNFNSDSNRNQKKDLSKIICYRCDKSGHYASKCPDRLQKFQESNFTEQEDTDETVFLHETVGSNQVQGNAELDRNQRHL